MARGRYGGCYIRLGLAVFLTAAALALLAVAFATDHWNEYVVTWGNPSGLSATELAALQNNKLYWSYNRGLWWRCYLRKPAGAAWYYDCEGELGYELSPVAGRENWSTEYKVRVHLLRLMFAMFVLGMLFLGVALLWSFWALCSGARSTLWTAEGMVFAGMFLTGIGMAVFHVIDFLERQRIMDDPYFYARIASDDNYAMLRSWLWYGYGYSYILGWVSMGVSLLAGLMFLCAASSVKSAGCGGGRSSCGGGCKKSSCSGGCSRKSSCSCKKKSSCARKSKGCGCSGGGGGCSGGCSGGAYSLQSSYAAAPTMAAGPYVASYPSMPALEYGAPDPSTYYKQQYGVAYPSDPYSMYGF